MSLSPHGLELLMTVFAEVFDAFGLTISEKKTEIIWMQTSRAPATPIAFDFEGQQYRQVIYFAYLGGTVIEFSNLSTEVGRRVIVGWMGFSRCKLELNDHPKASLLHLKARMLKSKIL